MAMSIFYNQHATDGNVRTKPVKDAHSNVLTAFPTQFLATAHDNGHPRMSDPQNYGVLPKNLSPAEERYFRQRYAPARHNR